METGQKQNVDKKKMSGDAKEGMMVITEITRTISGNRYDNLSFKAVLTSGDDPIEVSKKLDADLRKAMSGIESQNQKANDIDQQRRKTVSLLERAIQQAQELDIPF